MGKRKVEVALRGQTFTLRSEKDEATLHALANFVGRKFDELSRQQSRLSPHELAILVALNIAEDLFDAEDRSARVRSELRDRSERILSTLNVALGEREAGALDEGDTASEGSEPSESEEVKVPAAAADSPRA